MPFIIPISQARADFPEYVFVTPLTPSEQKAAFQVRDKDGRDLCLKIISPDCDTARLKREIEALEKVSHPNVGRFIEYFYASKNGKQKHFFVEEFIDGMDLAAELPAGVAWPVGKVVHVFTGLAAGLESLRRAEIVHRDLKPTNIRIRPNGDPVIIDFGLARLLGRPDLTRTVDGAQLGTPCYFAPEQWQGTKHEIDHRTDLFALGILLHQALTGEHPFYSDGMTIGDLEREVCSEERFSNKACFTSLPDAWQRVVRRLLNKSRASRPHRAEQVARILSSIKS